MKILILGAASRLGPHVTRALEADHELHLTDIVEVAGDHPSSVVDISDLEQVNGATIGMDAVINCTVERRDRRRAFDVNTLGCYNVMRAAVEQKVSRVINTGPHFAIHGPTYEQFDYEISPDSPPHPGVNLYAHSKGIGQEISRVFARHHDLQVLMLLFYNFRDHDGDDRRVNHPHAVSWRDAARAVRCAVDVDLDRMPSRCEVFSIFADTPHGRFSNEKAKRLLDWQPRDALRTQWTRQG